jgi:hypothetical protein
VIANFRDAGTHCVVVPGVTERPRRRDQSRGRATLDALRGTGDLHLNTDHLPPDEIARLITTGREGPARS